MTDEQKVWTSQWVLAKHWRKNMTPAEKRLWEAVRAHQLNGWHFRRQHVIGNYVVDFYCAKAKLVVELDGAGHEAKRLDDERRDKALMLRGLRVLRVPNELVFQDLPAVQAMIVRACEERGTPVWSDPVWIG